MKEIPQQVSESVRLRNPHLYGIYEEKVAKLGQGYVNEFCGPKPPKRIRQSTKPLMNKLEGEFMEHMQAFYPSTKFYPQAIKFSLGNGISYKPDMVCFDWGDGRETACWEVKGPHSFRGGFENLKVAARTYRDVVWYLVWKQNDRWERQMVLP